MLPREKGRRSRSITTSKLTRGVVPKLVRLGLIGVTSVDSFVYFVPYVLSYFLCCTFFG